MLTDQEKIDVRRHLGYPIAGDAAPSSFNGYRFFQAYGLLEYRMNHLSAAEEATLRSPYLETLTQLEQDLIGVRENSDTAEAAVWKRNPKELAERNQLYAQWQTRFAQFFGVPVYQPAPTATTSMRITV